MNEEIDKKKLLAEIERIDGEIRELERQRKTLFTTFCFPVEIEEIKKETRENQWRRR